VRFFIAILALFLTNSLLHSNSFNQLQQRIVEIFEQKQKSVVRVKAVFNQSNKEKDDKFTLMIGSGFFIGSEGLIITTTTTLINSKRKAERVWVEWNNQAIRAEILGHDRLTNISILKVESLPEGASFFNLDNTFTPTAIGSFALSIGCTLNFDPSPTLGIVKGYHSRFGVRVFPTKLMRTSIPGGPAESGSPVMDLNGSLLGVLVTFLPEVHSTLVLPVNAILRIRDDLLNLGYVNHAWFGIKVSVKELGQVVVDKIEEGSPAKKGKLLKGDRILKINNTPIKNIEDVRTVTFGTRPDKYSIFKVLRDLKEIDITIQAAALPKSKNSTQSKIIQPNGKSSKPSQSNEPESHLKTNKISEVPSVN